MRDCPARRPTSRRRGRPVVSHRRPAHGSGCPTGLSAGPPPVGGKRGDSRRWPSRESAPPSGGRQTMSRFLGGGEPDDTRLLDYEATLEALLSLIGRQVLILFSGTGGAPFIAGVLDGRLDRGELDERLQELLLRADPSAVETLFFHIGSAPERLRAPTGRVRARLLADRQAAHDPSRRVRRHGDDPGRARGGTAARAGFPRPELSDAAASGHRAAGPETPCRVGRWLPGRSRSATSR